MNNKLKDLYEKVSADDNLAEALKKGLEAASSEDEKKDFIINFAKEQGVTISKEDFAKLESIKHISDDELENVVGGGMGDAIEEVCGAASAAFCAAMFATSYICDVINDNC